MKRSMERGKMKLGKSEIGYINAFEDLAGVSARGCLASDEEIIFLVNGNQMGLAIGKNGQTIAKIREKMRKNVEVFEYGENAEDFVRKAFHQAKVRELAFSERDGRKLLFASFEAEQRKKALQSLAKLRKIKEILKRNYGIDDLIVK